MNGKMLSNRTYPFAGKNKTAVDAAQLKPGAYVVQVQTATASESFKIIKQ